MTAMSGDNEHETISKRFETVADERNHYMFRAADAEAQVAALTEALRYMADYQMTGTEQTLHIDFQGKAREALSRVSRSEPAPPNEHQGANSADFAEIREALEVARQRHAALGLVVSEGTGYGPSVGVAMAHHEGQAEILAIFEAAISGDWPEPEPLPKRLYGPEARDDRAAPPVPEEQQ